jgi:hypothetical protein
LHSSSSCSAYRQGSTRQPGSVETGPCQAESNRWPAAETSNDALCILRRMLLWALGVRRPTGTCAGSITSTASVACCWTVARPRAAVCSMCLWAVKRPSPAEHRPYASEQPGEGGRTGQTR